MDKNCISNFIALKLIQSRFNFPFAASMTAAFVCLTCSLPAAFIGAALATLLVASGAHTHGVEGIFVIIPLYIAFASIKPMVEGIIFAGYAIAITNRELIGKKRLRELLEDSNSNLEAEVSALYSDDNIPLLFQEARAYAVSS